MLKKLGLHIEAEKPKESFLEHDNPQYSSDISRMIKTEKPSQLFNLDHCDFVNVESSVKTSHEYNPFSVNTASLKNI